MKRNEFIRSSLTMGLGLPFLPSVFLSACQKDDSIFPSFETDFSGKVIIVGAGAAGMAAGYLLKRYGIDFEILEAAPVVGGRLKRAEGFADFPIDIGAEWIHTDPSILANIINDPLVSSNVEIVVYNPQTIQSWNNGQLRSHNFISNFYSEWKFKNTTWFGFFEQYLLPHVEDRVRLNTPVVSIDYSDAKVRLTTTDEQLYEADKVLITVPVKVLQDEIIGFAPALPSEKLNAINSVKMGDGIKIFVEFSERFYPDILAFGNVFSALIAEEKFVYDAAFRKDSARNILGLFAINQPAAEYTQLGSDEAIIAKFLQELDGIFDGKASQFYVKHIIQNWSAEPFIRGAYSYGFDGDQETLVAAISEPISDRIYFAGEALVIENQSTVHGACESAYSTVARMLASS
ncbi:MAG: FAD-dependent oxidoreductase [Bacteroidetes bacterium]|nr:MAG: FAD-dependent oxidoreductase [Bacteroidota bacterium]